APSWKGCSAIGQRPAPSVPTIALRDAQASQAQLYARGGVIIVVAYLCGMVMGGALVYALLSAGAL
ncbi:hypothetical protein LCGC14_2373490, partial [marine sediment metagenome]